MGKVFCSSDWHGCGKLAKKVIEYLQPDDTLYFLGDAIDRGEDGIEILQMFMKDNRVKFLGGNHEKMMYDTTVRPSRWEKSMWFQNGGSKTIEKFDKLKEQEKREIIEYIKNGFQQTSFTYKTLDGKTIIMEHAGYTPGRMPTRTHDPLWDRGHFYDSWPEEHYRTQKDMSDIYLVHGHTPIQYLLFEYGFNGSMESITEKKWLQYKREWHENGVTEFKPKILRYCDGHKFDIDMCTVASKRIALLDLETFDEIYFDEEEGE